MRHIAHQNPIKTKRITETERESAWVKHLYKHNWLTVSLSYKMQQIEHISIIIKKGP